MEWLDQLIDQPGAQFGILYIIYQLGNSMFRWLNARENTESKEADNILALSTAIGSLATTTQTSTAAYQNIAQIMKDVPPAMAAVVEGLKVQTEDMKAFFNQVKGDHQTSLANQTTQTKHILEVQKSQDVLQSTLEDTQDGLGNLKDEVQKMVQEAKWQEISDKLDTLINEVRTLREENETHYKRTEKRLDAVEAAVPPLQAQLTSLSDANHMPEVENEVPPSENTTRDESTNAAPASETPAASFSKSQARTAKDVQETPAVTTNGNGKTEPTDNDNDDKGLVDPVPSG